MHCMHCIHCKTLACGGFRASATALLLCQDSIGCVQALGHTWIDIMKIDIEGSEYSTFQHLAEQHTLPFTQLQIEVHQNMGSSEDRTRGTNHNNLNALMLLHTFLSNSFRTMYVEPNIYFAAQTCSELALIKMDGCGNVIAPVWDAANSTARD